MTHSQKSKSNLIHIQTPNIPIEVRKIMALRMTKAHFCFIRSLKSRSESDRYIFSVTYFVGHLDLVNPGIGLSHKICQRDKRKCFKDMLCAKRSTKHECLLKNPTQVLTSFAYMLHSRALSINRIIKSTFFSTNRQGLSYYKIIDGKIFC